MSEPSPCDHLRHGSRGCRTFRSKPLTQQAPDQKDPDGCSGDCLATSVKWSNSSAGALHQAFTSAFLPPALRCGAAPLDGGEELVTRPELPLSFRPRHRGVD